MVAVFEIGSIVCALAPSPDALFVVRAVSGMGAADSTSGAFLLIDTVVPLQSQPKWIDGVGAVFGSLPYRTHARIRSPEISYGKTNQLDPLGFALIGPVAICLLFVMQWVEVRYI